MALPLLGSVRVSGRPPRIAEFDYVGLYRYFLTICTFERARVFVQPDLVAPVLEQFRRLAGRDGFALFAYCFMPDHLHLLVEGTQETSDLRRFVFTAKQSSGFTYKRAVGRRLWQEGYYDHVLRDEEATIVKARYIVENPVRAGFARTIQEYPFSGSDVYTLDQLAEAAQDSRWRSRD